MNTSSNIQICFPFVQCLLVSNPQQKSLPHGHQHLGRQEDVPMVRWHSRQGEHRHGLFGEGHHRICAGFVNVHLLATMEKGHKNGKPGGKPYKKKKVSCMVCQWSSQNSGSCQRRLDVLHWGRVENKDLIISSALFACPSKSAILLAEKSVLEETMKLVMRMWRHIFS